VFKRYDDRKKGKGGKLSESFAVNDLTITCSDGEFVGILGPSGCGKTTTLRMIAGLEEITAGEIYIDDTLINNLHPKDRHIGLAFEDYALYPPLTVYDNIAFNLRAKNMDEENIKKEIMRIAPLMKVEDLLDMKPAALSGGQKQRVNITRALVRRPKLLLLDEPLSHLDGKMRQILRTELKRLHKEVGCTTIIVTHDQLEAMSLADKICIMKDGLLQQFGTPYEVYDDPVNVFVAGFIGEPPMNLNKVIITEEDNVLFFSFLESLVKVAVPAKYTKVLKLGMSVILGIRPNDLIIAEDGSPVKIAVFENLGDEKRIGIRIGEEYLTLITPMKSCIRWAMKSESRSMRRRRISSISKLATKSAPDSDRKTVHDPTR
jgi:multiple sugar transport system ATP-binding protein